MSVAAGHFESAERQRASAELGMWVILATEVMFFGPLFLAYAWGRVFYAADFAAASVRTHVVIGTANTAILLTSSLCVALAVRAARLDDRRRTLWLLGATAVLGAAFLALKGIEYRLEWSEHFVPWLDFRFAPAQAEGAAIFYYMYFTMTGLHAFHLSVGVVMVVVFAWRLRARTAGEISANLEIGALYWHFVDVVWVFLFPLIYLVERHG